MKLHKIQSAVAIFLAILLFANPVVLAAGSAVFAGASINIAGPVYSAQTSDTYNLEQELGDMVNQGVLDPLLETVGGYFGGLLEDQRLKDILSEIIDEILEDERIPELDALAVEVLRDERLAQILGDVIGDYLGSEELLSFIEEITADISALLKNEEFVAFFERVVTGFLRDDRINQFVFEIIEALMGFPQQILENIGDGSMEQAVLDVVEHFVELFQAPVLAHSTKILEDPRVSEALEKIINRAGELPEEYMEALLDDEAFLKAVQDLTNLFLEPLQEFPQMFLNRLIDAGTFNHLLDLFLAELLNTANYSEVSYLIEQLQISLNEALETIGDEVSAVIGYYAENAMNGDDGFSIIDIIMDFVLDESDVVDQAGDFLMYWADVAAWVGGQKSEEIVQVFDKYFGEDAVYTESLVNAVMEASQKSRDDLISTMTPLLEEHMEGFDLTSTLNPILEAHLDEFFDGTFDQILLEALAEMPVDELLQLVNDKGLLLLGILGELISALSPELSGNQDIGLENGVLSGLLQDIVLEIPFDVLADLFSAEDIRNLVDGLFELTDNLPLDTVAPYIRSNSHHIGFTVASTLLNGLADSIEAEKSETVLDPRREAIMALLKNEERMRSFYLDLGGANPDTITAESDETEIILSVFLEIIGDQNRLDPFRKELEERSEPVLEELIDYGKIIGKSIMEGTRALLHPFTQRFFSLFSYFYEGDAEGEPPDWLAFERISDNVKKTGGLTAEMLWDSGASGFLDQTLSRFLLDHGAVEDTATAERFSVINLFFAEMAGVGQLKELAAEDFAEQLPPVISGELLSLRESITRQLDASKITSSINSLLAGLIPGAPGELFRISIGSTPFTAKGLMEMIAGPMDDGITSIRDLFDGLVSPIAEMPGDILGDERTAEALDEIFLALPKPAVDLAAELLKDERVKEFVRAAAEKMLLAALNQSLDLAVKIVEDPRTGAALEDAIITIAADEHLRLSTAELVGDLLTDPDLRNVIKSVLDNSRLIAIDYTGNNHGGFYGAGAHDFTGHPDLPAPYDFTNATIRLFTLGVVPAPDHYFQLGCNNGLYFFTEVLLEWFDPNTSFSSESPGEYMRSYIYDYMSEERIRTRIAEPVVDLTTRTTLRILNDRGSFENIIRNGIDQTLNTDPMGVIAAYLQSDPKITGLIEDSFKNFPLESVVQILRNNESIYGLVNDLFAGIPLEQLSSYFSTGENVESLIEDFGAEFNLDPLRPLLRADQGMIADLLNKVNSFPVEAIASFFENDQRAYRLGYITADLESRFITLLLHKPELAQFQSEIIYEKAVAADYTLAKSIFDATAKIIDNEPVIDYAGEKFFESLSRAYEAVKEFFRLQWGKSDKGPESELFSAS